MLGEVDEGKNRIVPLTLKGIGEGQVPVPDFVTYRPYIWGRPYTNESIPKLLTSPPVSAC